MKDLLVTAKDGKEGAEISITIQAPETIEEAIELFGGAVILSNALSNWVVTVQGGMRRNIRAGKKADEIQSTMGDAKMGQAAARNIDPMAIAIAKLKSMSPEEKEAFLQELKEQAGLE